MNVEQAIRSRRSIKTYDTSHEIDDATLHRIFEQVQHSPSSFNLQHWRFVVVRDQARRAELSAASFGQKHVADCSAVVVVCGKLTAHLDAARTNAHSPADVLKSLVPMIQGFYEGHEAFSRDETLRSCGLAAMTLMLVCKTEGLDTCPMIGFDPKKVAAIVELDEHHIPSMLITVGKHDGQVPFPTSRLDLEEIVKTETLGGKGLKAAN